MKNIILGLAFLSSAIISAQYIEDAQWANQYPNYGYVENNQFYFPEDYYYEYPEDYYEDQYYLNMYYDYRNSIEMVNWRRFFRENRLSRRQINLILDLNRQFITFQIWNNYYRMNPRRWWYDRFYALEMILGPRVFVVFQNNFYNGFSPVVYYNNYWVNNYKPRFVCRPAYRNIQVHNFRINKNHFHSNIGNRYGWNQPRNANRGGNGFREENRNNGYGYRNEQVSLVNNGRRENNIQRENNSNRNPGIRNENKPENMVFRDYKSLGSRSDNQLGIRSNTNRITQNREQAIPSRSQRQTSANRENNSRNSDSKRR